jgi:altronate dehydratase small subunit
MPRSAIVVNPDDNVATALQLITKGAVIQVETGDKTIDITILQDIPFGHKFALKNISEVKLLLNTVK